MPPHGFDSPTFFPGVFPALVSLAVVIFAMQSATTAVFIVRRNTFPLKARGLPHTVLMGVTSAIFAASMLAAKFSPCVVTVLAYPLGSQATLIMLLMRTWSLLFRFHMHDTVFKLNLLLLQPDTDHRVLCREKYLENWYIRHRWIGKTSSIWLVGSVYLLIWAVCLILTALALSPTDRVAPCAASLSDLVIYKANSVAVILLIIASLCLANLLRGFSGDAYSLKPELVGNAVCGLCLLTLYQLFKATVPPQLGLTELALLALVASFSVWCVLYPVILSLQTARLDSLQARRLDFAVQDQTTHDLIGFLETREGLDSWLRFLHGEFSTENMLFLQEGRQFRAWLELEQKVIPETIVEFRTIIAQYCMQDSICAVNISSNTRKKLLLLAETAETLAFEEIRDALDTACAEVFNLLRRDCWPRFRSSSLYKQVLHDRASKLVQDSILIRPLGHSVSACQSHNKRPSPKSSKRRSSATHSRGGSASESRWRAKHIGWSSSSGTQSDLGLIGSRSPSTSSSLAATSLVIPSFRLSKGAQSPDSSLPASRDGSVQELRELRGATSPKLGNVDEVIVIQASKSKVEEGTRGVPQARTLTQTQVPQLIWQASIRSLHLSPRHSLINPNSRQAKGQRQRRASLLGSRSRSARERSGNRRRKAGHSRVLSGHCRSASSAPVSKSTPGTRRSGSVCGTPSTSPRTSENWSQRWFRNLGARHSGKVSAFVTSSTPKVTFANPPLAGPVTSSPSLSLNLPRGSQTFVRRSSDTKQSSAPSESQSDSKSHSRTSFDTLR